MKFTKITFVALCLAVLFTMSAFAAVPYATYTYDIDGNLALSPDAYVPDRLIDSADLHLGTALSSAKDLFVDSHENVYIADTKNNRILVCNSDFEVQFALGQFYNQNGILDTLSEPQGVFVNELEIFVADTENNRIVVFDRFSGDFKRIIEQPSSDVFPEGSVYKPVAVAVDEAGRIYVVSSTTTYGVISMDYDGTFLGFLGAQKVTPSAFDIFWRNFQTKAQRAQSLQYVPTEYNNITIDADGFIYVTTSTIDEGSQQGAIESKSKSADYAPVKKLNPKGYDVMNRNGFYPPSGEVKVQTEELGGESDITGPSKIIDVALGPCGMWSIIDEKRSKVFTYDADGNLLFIFGDKGSQLGNIANIQSVVYKGNDMLILDKSNDTITIYKRTEYGDTLAAALQNTQDRLYDKAVVYWQEILQKNSNFDMAYIGIGDSLYRQGDYDEAMEMYQMAYAVEDYSNSFKQIRKHWMEKWIILVPIVVVALFILVSKFFKYANKVNVAGQKMKEKRSFKETFLYTFHIIFHPFDGFWDMKHEKRGSMTAALTVVLITILSFIYKSAGTAYIFNPESTGVSYMGEILGVVLPYLLWGIANWCLTTLFDGEGKMSDIFMATGYSLLPIPMMIIPTTICSNFLLLEEGSILSMINVIGYIWAGFLIFFAMQVIHDFQLGKNAIMCVATIVGMAFIMFLGVLFSGLLGKIVSFVYNIYVELSYRM
jgi:sugar lactone lactonase YvrE